MKYLIFILVSVFFCSISNAQTIDSIVVKNNKSYSSISNKFLPAGLEVDSFANGKLIGQNNYYYQYGRWKTSNWIHYEYSGTNDTIITEYRIQNDRLTEYNKRVITQLSPLSFSNLQYQWNNGWILYVYAIDYYQLGGQINSSRQRFQAAPWDSLFVTYSYNAMGLITGYEVDEYDFSFDEWWAIETINWDRDSLGNDTLETHLYWLLLSVTFGYNYHKTFDSLNKITQRIRSSYDVNGGYFYATDTLIFNNYYFGDTLLTLTQNSVGDSSLSQTLVDSSGLTIFYQLNTWYNSNPMGGSNYDVKNYTYPSSPDFVLYKYRDSLSICNDFNSVPNIIAIGGIHPLNYQWSPSWAVSNDTLPLPIIISSGGHWLSLRITDGTNVVLEDSVYLTVVTGPTLIATNSNGTSCIGCTDGFFVPAYSIGSSSFLSSIVTDSSGAIVVYTSNDSLLNLAPGPYNVCIIDQNQCRSCMIDTIWPDPTLVFEVVSSPLHFYPNPATSKIHIPDLNSISVIEIVSSSGQIVNRCRIDANDNIDVSDLSVGWYLLRIIKDDEIKIGKLIVK